MKLKFIPIVLISTGCAVGNPMHNVSDQAAANIACGWADSSRSGMIMIDGEWRHCSRTEHGAPSFERKKPDSYKVQGQQQDQRGGEVKLLQLPASIFE